MYAKKIVDNFFLRVFVIFVYKYYFCAIIIYTGDIWLMLNVNLLCLM